jgi:Dolichyl-phosphate-mannose-protein mannosyltransferase
VQDDSAPIDTRFRIMSLLAICLLSAVIGRLVFLCNPFDADAAIFIYMGKMTYLGGRMCHDFLDNKFPTVGLMMTLPWRLLGNQWAAYVLFSSSLALASCLILAETAKRSFGRNAGLATLFFALVYLNFTRTVFGGFQLETFQVFFDCIAVFFLMECLRSDRWLPALIAGMAAGCAAMFKPTGLTVLLAFAACRFAFPRPTFKQLFAIAAGVAIPAAAALAYLIAADLLYDMPALYRQIAGYAANSAVGLPNLLKMPTVLCGLGVPLFFRFWLFRRRTIEIPRNPRITAARLFVLAWFCLEIIAVLMQRRMYWYHFIVVAAPAAMIFGMIPRRTLVVMTAACVMPLAILSIGAASDALDQLYKGTPTLPTSDYLLTHAAPGDRVWDENASRLLLETNLQAGARCVLTFLFANTDDSPTIFSQQILGDLTATRPKYIVLKTQLDNWVYYESRNIWDIQARPMRRVNYERAWRNIDAYVTQNYVPVARMDKDTIWERRGIGNAIATIK